ncbi:MAG: UDP-N-acetylmuramoyl-L-alanyl-D-glutamate--2,6-diaminopimelate ligase [Desulfobacterales bacterium]|jgi:UDP-N-acetylmuramyl-tripeptide synthetase
MNFARLIESVHPAAILGSVNPETVVASLHYQSRDVGPGGVFFAIPGFAVDGHDFIQDACQRGAAAVVAQKPVTPGVPVLQVADSRTALAQAAAAYYDYPSRELTLIGLTGTNGKTTVSYLIENMLTQAGLSTGVIGSVNYRFGHREVPALRTTPESLDLQRILADMRGHGVTHVVMEVASHGLDLHRVDACWFDVAAFTNLSQDHLDFHGDMERYWASKKALFTRLLPLGPKGDRALAVINRDDERGQGLSEAMTGERPTITFGRSPENTIWPEVQRNDLTGIEALLHSPRGTLKVRSAMVGEHNLENILTAVGCAIAIDLPIAAIEAGVAATTAVPGRLEPVADPGGRFIYVDYAHTPDALENVLRALDAICQRRLICVFGCGGDRDRSKRPLMGEIAGRMSDLAVVTSDNPRTEDPLAIIEDALEGVRRTAPLAYTVEGLHHGLDRPGHIVMPDRQGAIDLAIRVAQPGDTVLIAGKGHETYQIIGRTTIPFDDREAARKALASGRERPTKETA